MQQVQSKFLLCEGCSCASPAQKAMEAQIIEKEKEVIAELEAAASQEVGLPDRSTGLSKLGYTCSESHTKSVSEQTGQIKIIGQTVCKTAQ
jgi:hypothetical protein